MPTGDAGITLGSLMYSTTMQAPIQILKKKDYNTFLLLIHSPDGYNGWRSTDLKPKGLPHAFMDPRT